MQTVKPDMVNQALDNQEILQYLEGKLPAARKQAIDELLAKDPFLADAVEGLSYVKDPLARANAIKDIQQSVVAKSGAKLESKSIKLNYAAISGMAAMLVVAVSSFFLIRHYAVEKDEKIAKLEKQVPPPTLSNKNSSGITVQQTPPAPVEQGINKPMSLHDTVGQGTNTYSWTVTSGATSSGSYDLDRNEVAADEQRQSAPVANTISSGDVIDQSPATKSETKSKNSKPGIIKGQVIDAKSGAPISGARVFVQGKQSTLTSANGNYELALEPGTYEVEYSQNGYEDQGKKLSVKADEQQPVRINVNLHKSFDGYTANNIDDKDAEKANDNNPNNFKQGIEEYSKGQYKQARVTLDKAISADPSNIDAVYYAGLSYYNSYSPGKSIAYFDKVIRSGSKYKEDAQWYKAQALMQKGLKDEAKKVLTDISLSKSKYKDRAAKALTDY